MKTAQEHALHTEIHTVLTDIQSGIEKTTAIAYEMGEISGRKKVIAEVLEIINNIEQKSDDVSSYDVGFAKACREIRAAVQALKGGEG